jgi:hypothetical protein
MWVWQSISEKARGEGREQLAADLDSGAWDERYGHLRETAELDVGLRLVVAELARGSDAGAVQERPEPPFV